MNLETIQSALRDYKLDGWLFYDHHHRDPIAYRILGLDEASFVSRRWFYFIPATGQPRKLVHRIESGKLDKLPGAKTEYSSWQELEASLEKMLTGATKIAMQYSPRNAIMYVAMVDAGTVELVRSFGKDVASSADLVSLFEAVLTEAQIATHFEAQQRLDRVLTAGWQYIADSVHIRRDITEMEVVNFLLEGISREGLYTDHGPNCSVGPNSADSHYEPTPFIARPIRSGDFVLIDIWAKLADSSGVAQPHAIWYDITWTAVVNRPPTDRETLIFNTVRDARDAAITAVETAFAANRPHRRFRSRRCRPQRHPQRRIRPVVHPPHRPQHRHRAPRQRRSPRQPRNPRRAPAAAPHLLLRRTRPLLPGRIRHPQRSRHDHPARQSGRHRPPPDRAPPRWRLIESTTMATEAQQLSQRLPGEKSSFPALVLLVGWLIPGAGHVLVRKPIRAALLFVSIIAMYSIGLGLHGKVYVPNTGDILDILGFIGQLGGGVLYFLARACGWGTAPVVTTLADYGTKFIVVTGLLNFIAAVDAHSLANGRKAS